jgi:hypothetical protein
MIGLIACGGSLPLIFAKAAKKKKIRLAVIAVQDMASTAIKKYADKYYVENIGKMGRMIRHFKKEGVKEAFMLGKVRKARLFKEMKPDLLTLGMLFMAKDNKDMTRLLSVIREFKKNGIKIMPVTHILKDLIAKKGVITKRAPSKREMKDIRFGLPIAKKIADLDIGQTVVVKDRDVLAVEGIEGTDSAILRGGKLARKGAVVVKVARTKQDMRVDVPGIGVETVRALKRAGVSCMAIQAGKMLVIEKEKIRNLAARFGISIICV